MYIHNLPLYIVENTCIVSAAVEYVLPIVTGLSAGSTPELPVFPQCAEKRCCGQSRGDVMYMVAVIK